MIDLHLRASFEDQCPPFVVKLRELSRGQHDEPLEGEALYKAGDRGEALEFAAQQTRFSVSEPGLDLHGDVVLCIPSRGVVQRLLRRSSRHNTLLLTERCDQLCAMCSQPPKNTNDEWRFPLYEEALLLAEPRSRVGISGGEPTLYKEQLLEMIERVALLRPDLSYHILTNGQHFNADDADRLRNLGTEVEIVWGVPLYSHRESVHDEIVGKAGAFRKLMANLFVLGQAGAKIELRTVITALNVFDLPKLGEFIGRHIPFIGDWAIMGMEPIGYARPNWRRLFFDHSVFPQPIVSALEISRLRGIPCHLYNVPRCTLPTGYRDSCVDSISDWKKKFLTDCDQCRERAVCSGFFEWYSPSVAWEGVAPIA